MSNRIPIGQREGQRLEFKAMASLRKPESIAREVVGMLNAEGGEIWIGIGEDSNGIGTEIQAIPEIEQEHARLVDVLLDRIEPSPAADEITIQTRVLENGPLLLVEVHPRSDNAPYAMLRQSARLYLRRMDARNVPMSRDELREAFSRDLISNHQGRDRERESLRLFLEERNKRIGSTEPGLLLMIRPTEPISLDVQSPLMGELMTIPERTDNRRQGWTFINPYQGPQLDKEGIRTEVEKRIHLRVYANGTICSWVCMQQLNWSAREHVYSQKGLDPSLAIYPFALLEYPVSMFRFASRVFREPILTASPVRNTTEVLADLSLLGIEGRSLGPHSPDSIGYLTNEHAVFKDGSALIRDEPIRFTMEDLRTNPDRCALRLIRWIYQGFGYSSSEIPRQFNQETGRLIIPD